MANTSSNTSVSTTVLATLANQTANTPVPIKVAQTFYLDPGTVNGAGEVNLTQINLYCRQRPNQAGTSSGIQNPGVTLYLIPTSNSTPSSSVLNNLSDYQSARLEYTDLVSSLDATVASSF